MPGSYATFQDTDRFGSLDGLRAASIVAVIWCHTAASAWSGIPLLSRGDLGVELFFAISGFLITTLLLRERRDAGAISPCAVSTPAARSASSRSITPWF